MTKQEDFGTSFQKLVIAKIKTRIRSFKFFFSKVTCGSSTTPLLQGHDFEMLENLHFMSFASKRHSWDL